MVAAEFRRPHARTAPHRTVFRVGFSSPWSSVLLNRIIFFTTADCSRSIILLIKSTPRADRYDHDDDDDDQDGDGDDRDETVNALKLYAAQSTEPPDGRDRSRGHHTYTGGGGDTRARRRRRRQNFIITIGAPRRRRAATRTSFFPTILSRYRNGTRTRTRANFIRRFAAVRPTDTTTTTTT